MIRSPTEPDAEQLLSEEVLKHIVLDLRQMKSFVRDPLVIEKADGVWYEDVNGKRYLDGVSGIFVVAVGHGNRRVIEAIQSQLALLEFAPPLHATNPTAIQLATKIAAFLVPNGYDPPLMSGGQTLAPELFSHAVAYAMVERQPVYRQIQFSGRTWNVKASETLAGPGPNYFSDSEEDVWVDEGGQLHLRIVYRNDRWYCTEVFTTEPLGYGTYTFTLASPADQLDKNVVLGLFTWDDMAPEYNYREIDIEFSRWGEEGAQNAQFVVQPWDHTGNRHRFNLALQGQYSTHWFDWDSGSVHFSSYQGHQPDLGDEIETWVYTGADTPPAGAGNARINLWLLNGNPPSDGQDVEVVVEAFQFVAQGE